MPPEIDAGQRGERLLKKVNSVGVRADAMQRYPQDFSDGQRQRIAIAWAVAVERQVIICDEPMSALGVSVRAQMLNLLRQLQSETGGRSF